MFFEPPVVKSLSKYSEFGMYLGSRHFAMMLLVAFGIHAAIIIAMMMSPHEEVVKIPVRVLNFNLVNALDDTSPQPQLMPLMPAPAEASQPVNKTTAKTNEADNVTKSVEIKTESAKIVQPFVNPTLLPQANPAKVVEDPLVNSEKKALSELNTMVPEPAATPSEYTLATPKQFVRTSDTTTTSTTSPVNNDTVVSPDIQAVVQRYEQSISLWLSKHKSYPEEARVRKLEGDAVVRIRINREGHILYQAIDRSSGNTVIDAAVLAMVQASDPVPAVPFGYPAGNQFEFLIPVSFRLK